jgi:hypothetical protein
MKPFLILQGQNEENPLQSKARPLTIGLPDGGGACLQADSTTGIRSHVLYDRIVFCHNLDMTAPRTRNSRVFTISFPEPLAKQVLSVAKEENRNVSELFREAFRTYRMQRNGQRLIAARAAAAQRGAARYSEDDVEALVDEIRSRQLKQRKQPV